MQGVYVDGYVGNLGTKVLIEKKYDELVNYFSVEFLYFQKRKLEDSILIKGGIVPSLSFFDNKLIDKEEISKGGFLSALWKICDRNKWGLKYNLKEVPIMQSSIEIANYFDLNPYRLLTKSVNIYVIDDVGVDMESFAAHVVRNDVGANACGTRLAENTICPFVKIGEIVDTKKRVRIDGEVEAFLTKDYKDEIDKVLPRYTKEVNGVKI